MGEELNPRKLAVALAAWVERFNPSAPEAPRAFSQPSLPLRLFFLLGIAFPDSFIT